MRLLAIDFWNTKWMGVTYYNYAWFLALVLVALLFKRPFSKLFAKLTSRLAVRFTGGKYRGLFRSLICKPVEWLFAIVLLFMACNYITPLLNRLTLLSLHRGKKVEVISLADVLDRGFLLFAIIFLALTVSRAIDFFYRSQMEDAHRTLQKERSQILPLVKEIIKFLIWIFAFFWILGSVFLVNIPALIAGLGIGGVALALAAKESIENLFASLTILSDKPFLVGDTIKTSGIEGKVERIGFRSARLRGSDGSMYVIPNKKLVMDNVENLTQRSTRGIKVPVHIKYGMSHDALQQMTGNLRQMIENTPHVIAPIRVNLDAFNEEGLQLLISYHLPEPLIDGNEVTIRQSINQNIYSIITAHTTFADGPPAPPAEPQADEPSDD